MKTIKKILARGENKKGERISVIEKIETDEMTCAGIFIVVDGEWNEIGDEATAMNMFRDFINE